MFIGRNPVVLTRSLALIIFAIGMFCAFWSPKALANVYILGFAAVAVVGSGLYGWKSWFQTKLSAPDIQEVKPGFMLFAGQISLCLLSFIFFAFLEMQTRINPRLQALEVGTLFDILQSHIFMLGILPWVTYSFMGVAFAYFFVCRKRIPYLPNVIMPRHRLHPKLFIYNFLIITFDIISLMPFVLVVAFAIIMVCEMVNRFSGYPSLMDPFAMTPFILAFLILALLKLNLKVIEWVDKHKIALGKMLIFYILFFSTLLLFFHYLISDFLSGNASSKTALNSMMFLKSQLVGSFSEEQLNTRLMLLIWGWWGIWVPWMSSLIARFSIGLPIWKAFLRSLLIPLLVFGSIFKMTTMEWVKFQQGLQNPFIMVCISIFIVLFILFWWGRIHTTADMERGCMPSSSRMQSQSLQRWLSLFLVWLSCYLPAWLMMGWVPAQIIVTFGSSFMLIVISLFLGALVYEIFHLPPSPQPSPGGGRE